MKSPRRVRPLIAFFDYADVFEDFYPRYGIDQRAFASWTGSGNHAFLSLLQREVGDVVWYVLSLQPDVAMAVHETIGCRIKFVRSSLVHRALWRAFYTPRQAWRWRSAYRAYATIASYVAPVSLGLLREIRRDRPDAVFVESYSSGRFDTLLVAAHGLGVPLAAYHAGGVPEGYLGGTIRRWTLPRADRLLVSSETELEMLATRFRVARDRVRVVLTPIDVDVFRPLRRDEACARSGLDPGRRYLLYVGRLDDPVKRVGALIEAFARVAGDHPDVDLLIVGDGQNRTELRRLAERVAAGRIVFLGWVSGASRLAPLYASADCLVLWSVREGFPTVVGEALACGTPVLSSNVGAISEVVVDGVNGWLIDADDEDGLRRRLEDVLAQPEMVGSMRAAARAQAEHRIAPQVVSAQLRECFADVRVGGR